MRTGNLRRRVVWLSGLVALAAVIPGSARVGSDNLRSLEVLRLRCVSELSLEDVTFFGNGTLRLFERLGEQEERTMLLTELHLEEREALYQRVAELELEESQTFGDGIDGEYLDQCILSRRLVGDPGPWMMRFHQLDSLSIGLQRGVDLAREIAGIVRDRAPFSGIPADYRPKVGDLLRKPRSGLYEIVGFARDTSGVESVIELVGIEEPLRIWVPIAQIPEVFVSIEDELP